MYNKIPPKKSNTCVFLAGKQQNPSTVNPSTSDKVGISLAEGKYHIRQNLYITADLLSKSALWGRKDFDGESES